MRDRVMHMELDETVGRMTSDDYAERFRAEYEQLEIRRGRLNRMLAKWAAGTLDFEPSCPHELLNEQSRAMMEYSRILEARADIEGIGLERPEV